MNKYLKLIFATLILYPSQPVLAASLDEIYRDIVRSDNEGYLPIFIKNRNAPDLLFGDELKALTKQTPDKIENEKVINLINKRKLRKEEELAEIKKWHDAVNAVQNNRVTPVVLEEIEKYAAEDDGKAIEILAWMYTRGIGVKQDLIQAFRLYRKAETLNVPNAKKNAIIVYKEMSAEQREILSRPQE